MHEWPLLIFTLLLQGSVGLTLMLTFALCADRRRFNRRVLTTQNVMPTLWVICIMGGLGLLASVFHLGYPLNAFNALRHVSSSWLSREIVFASLFLGCAGFGLLLGLFKAGLWRGLIPLALLAGLVDVYCMGAIYMHTSVVTWMHVNTAIMFFGSVAIVGPVLGVALLPAEAIKKASLLTWGPVIAIAAVAVRLLAQPSLMAWLNEAAMSDALTFPHQPLAAFSASASLRLTGWCLSVAGVLLFACGGFKARRGWLIAGGALLLLAEVLLRFTFFSIH